MLGQLRMPELALLRELLLALELELELAMVSLPLAVTH